MILRMVVGFLWQGHFGIDVSSTSLQGALIAGVIFRIPR